MDISFWLENFSFNPKALLDYGFVQNGSCYLLHKELESTGMTAVFCLSQSAFTVSVFDDNTNEKYIPFDLPDSTGNFVGTLREKTEEIANDIAKRCLTSKSLRGAVLNFVKTLDDTYTRTPWKRTPEYVTLNLNSGKWFGLVMNIPKRFITGDSDVKVDVINLKLDPDEIKSLIDFKTFFPAYHMNKKYWITVLLNRDLSEEKLFSLIKKSYDIVKNKTKNSIVK